MKINTLLALSGLLTLAFTAGASAASKTWTYQAGTSSKAAISASATASATANTSSCNVAGNAYADVAVLGSGYYRIASASGTATGTKTNCSLTGRIDFLGGNLWSYNSGISLVSLNASRSFSKSWTPAVSPFFMVSVVKVTVTPTVSAGLTSSVSAGISPAAQSFTGTLTPATVDLGASVTASAIGGLVRVTGAITVGRVSPSLTSSCSFKNRQVSSSASINYSALGGSIDLAAGKSWYEVTYNLMSWAGYSSSTSLYNETVSF
jgi:hypothetical protein